MVTLGAPGILAALCISCGGLVDADPVNDSRDPITGGVVDASRPAVAALVDPDTLRIFCSATLISVDPPRLLTAAHCLDGSTPADLKAAFGPSETAWKDVIDVTTVVVHPNYDSSFANPKPSDIGYVDLARAPVVDSVAVTPIAANSSDIMGREDESWLFMGYGVDRKVWLKRVGKGPYNWVGAGTKRSVSIVIDHIYGPTRGEFDYTADPVEGSEEAANTCFGDSGGPALAPAVPGGPEVVMGVTSRGDSDCGAINSLGIDTRVDTFTSWLNGADPVCGDGICDGSETCTSCGTDCECPVAGGQCSTCAVDADCADGGRCFRLTTESAKACHLACESTLDCPSGYSCGRITGGYGKRCIACE
jgi:hypothetical protein